MSVILKAENISKQYRLGTVGTGTLSHDLNRWWYKVRGKEDPYLKIGDTNDRSKKATSDYVWALKDINFEVEKGEVLGIIGKNGAGKSTLLKILSRVTTPTTGSIKCAGRIASLLEVGTGFHPELTGRENIYLNGAILGMTKAEITSKLDEIVYFSGCERYVDTPVKRYSSGMKVRLAFAVAAHLEPEILVVDEVLAVGDAEFQKKAIGKMQDISKGEGRTVLFVSHNMESIQQLCTSGIVMSNGNIAYSGDINSCIDEYLSMDLENFVNDNMFPILFEGISLEQFYFKSETGKKVNSLVLGDLYEIFICFKNNSQIRRKLNVRYQIFDSNLNLITTINTYQQDEFFDIEAGELVGLSCFIEKWSISNGNYILGLEIQDLNVRKIIYQNKSFFEINVLKGDYYNSGKLPLKKNIGLMFTNHKWKSSKNDFT